MNGQTIIDFIKKHKLEECTDIDMDDYYIYFNISLVDGTVIVYSLGNYLETLTVYPGPSNCLKCPVEVTLEEAMKMREDNKVIDEYMVNYF